MRTVALDLGSRITYCEVKEAKVVERAVVVGMSSLVRLLGPNTPPANVAFEACREAWAVHDQLEAWGHKPVMIDTTRVRQLGVGQHGRKTDRLDAEALALALEVGRIPLAHVLSPHRRELRLQLSVRRALVETRAQYVTSIRSLVRAGGGGTLPQWDTENFAARLPSAELAETTRALTTPLVEALEAINPQIVVVEAKLEQLCAKEPAIQQLCSAPGVGPIVAAVFVSVIDEAKRFRRAHEVESYLGLVPSENTSVKRRLGAITKRGNSYARAMLVQAAHCILRLRQDDPLKQWGEAIAERRGKRVATVAIARRLVGVLWSMWLHGTTYSTSRAANDTARGLDAHARELARAAEDHRHAATPSGNKRPSGKAAPRTRARGTAPAQRSTREVG
jgi:transposase